MSRPCFDSRQHQCVDWILSWSGVFLACLLMGCGTLSIHEETRIGEVYAQQAAQQYRFVQDSLVVRYVQDIGRQLVQAAGPQAFRYRFFVVDAREINAFAGPAGYVYVNTETILMAQNVSELAGVMAHEIGHVARRHIAQNYNRSRNTELAYKAGVVTAGALGGNAAANVANLGGGLAAMAFINSFTREAEKEADVFAIQVLPRSGYHPHGLLSFFRMMLQERGGGAGAPSFLSSHPTTNERISRVQQLIRKQSLPANLRTTDKGRFEIIQRRIRLLRGDADPVR